MAADTMDVVREALEKWEERATELEGDADAGAGGAHDRAHAATLRDCAGDIRRALDSLEEREPVNGG